VSFDYSTIGRNDITILEKNDISRMLNGELYPSGLARCTTSFTEPTIASTILQPSDAMN